MDHTELDRLEANVYRAIETIQKLRQENRRLRQENEMLLNQLKEQKRDLEKSGNQSRDDGETPDPSSAYHLKELKIKQKIQQMLDKLETFQQLSRNE